jgi:peptidoglycan/xylan/chitin deacetylase (PgdA/CDA1 family)
VSFDDGLRSCRTAATMLADRGISACFFVLGDLVGEQDPRTIARICRTRLAMPPTDFLDWDDLEAMIDQGHLIGSHGMSHRRMSTMSSDEVDDELGRSHDLLAGRLGRADHFAWPYGHLADAPADIVERARRAGFRSAAANERGCHVRPISAGGPILRDHALATWPARQLTWFLDRNLRRVAAA